MAARACTMSFYLILQLLMQLMLLEVTLLEVVVLAR
jgi:hypothetical protein